MLTSTNYNKDTVIGKNLYETIEKKTQHFAISFCQFKSTLVVETHYDNSVASKYQ